MSTPEAEIGRSGHGPGHDPGRHDPRHGSGHRTGHGPGDDGHPKSRIVHAGKRRVRMREQSDAYIKVYVWELPVRVFHMVNALSILILIVTGLYIGKPFVAASIGEEAYYSNLMGWARYIHFFAAFAFTANLLVRWYWVFKGNSYATSNPFKRVFWEETWECIKFYLLLRNRKPHYTGHNPLAQLTYWILIGGGSLAAIFTGFYLYFEPQPESFFAKWFAWVPALFGSSFLVRSWHHWVAWGFILFIVVHVYLSFREDWLEKNGTLSSILTGYKTEKKDKVETHEPDAPHNG